MIAFVKFVVVGGDCKLTVVVPCCCGFVRMFRFVVKSVCCGCCWAYVCCCGVLNKENVIKILLI